MPEMDDREGIEVLRLTDCFSNGGSGAIVCHDHFKLTHGLPVACCQDEPENFRLVVDGDDQGQDR
jgi:hypothetical protein